MRRLELGEDGRPQLLRRKELETTWAPRRRQGKPQHSPGQVGGGGDKGGGGACFAQGPQDLAPHALPRCHWSLTHRTGLGLDVQNVILTLPMELVVEGKVVSIHAGGEIPQIHEHAQGATANVEIPASCSPFNALFWH